MLYTTLVSHPLKKKKILLGVFELIFFSPNLVFHRKPIWFIHQKDFWTKNVQRGDKTKRVQALKTKDSQSYHLTSP